MEASETIASEFLSDMAAKLDEVLRFPFCGASRFHLAANLRVIFHGNYAIYYLPRKTETVIVRVLHGSRDIAAIVDREGFSD